MLNATMMQAAMAMAKEETEAEEAEAEKLRKEDMEKNPQNYKGPSMEDLINSMEVERNRRVVQDERVKKGEATITNEKVNEKTLEMLTDTKLLDAIRENASEEDEKAHFVVAIYRMEKKVIKDIACYDFPDGSHQKLKSFFTLDPPSSPKKIARKLRTQLIDSEGSAFKAAVRHKSRPHRSRSVIVTSNSHGHSHGKGIGNLAKIVAMAAQQEHTAITAKLTDCVEKNCSLPRMIGKSHCGVHLRMQEARKEMTAEELIDAKKELKKYISKLTCGNFDEEAAALLGCKKIYDMEPSGDYFKKKVGDIARAITNVIHQTSGSVRPTFLRIAALECLEVLFKRQSSIMADFLQPLIPAIISQMASIKSVQDGTSSQTVTLSRKPTRRPSHKPDRVPSMDRKTTKSRGKAGLDRKRSSEKGRPPALERGSISVSKPRGSTSSPAKMKRAKSVAKSPHGGRRSSLPSKSPNVGRRSSLGISSSGKPVKSPAGGRRASLQIGSSAKHGRRPSLGGGRGSTSLISSDSGKRSSLDDGGKRSSIDESTEALADLERLNEVMREAWEVMLNFMAVAKIQQYLVTFILNPRIQPSALYQAGECLLGCVTTLGKSAINSYCIDKIMQAIEVLFKQDDVHISSLGDQCIGTLTKSAAAAVNLKGDTLLIDLFLALKKNLKGADLSRAQVVMKKKSKFGGILSVDNLKKFKPRVKVKKGSGGKSGKKGKGDDGIENALSAWGISGLDIGGGFDFGADLLGAPAKKKRKPSSKKKMKKKGKTPSPVKEKGGGALSMWDAINAAGSEE